jgi:Domain of unknown function (DUF4276)
VVAVRIIIEGGKAGKRADDEFRESWHEFLKRALPQKYRSPRIIVGGSRQESYKTFKFELKEYPEHFTILLIDSEDAIAEGTRVWQHLADRKDDNMPQPEEATDKQAHLMVRSMECWFLADRDALRRYYQKDFNENALPKNLKIEDIDRHEATDCLDRAAKNTSKKGYHKSNDGFKLIGLIDAGKVRGQSPYADRFFKVLEEKLKPQ